MHGRILSSLSCANELFGILLRRRSDFDALLRSVEMATE